MTIVGFLTSDAFPELTADDRLAVAALAERGVRVEPLRWRDESADLARFDLVVIRSPWDWYMDRARFVARLRAIDARVPLWNREAWEWLDKRYLERLAARGAQVAGAQVVARLEDLEASLAAHEGAVVLKPAAAAGGYRTSRFDARDLAAARRALAAILEDDVALLQPFFPEVTSDGEWSLVFFGGRFSHAVKKHPPRGDFRVHEEFGGTITPATPPESVRAAASVSLAASGVDAVYARVDGIVLPALGGFRVTELEIVEPELFFRMEPAAPARFAEALLARVRVRPPASASTG